MQVHVHTPGERGAAGDSRPPAPRAPARVELWSCVGCGAIGMADLCTGACEDRAAEFVRAADHDAMLAAAAGAGEWAAGASELAREIAEAAPADVDWEDAWRCWQRHARAVLRARPQGRRPPGPDALFVERASTWWCTSCGRIEAPQPCLGVCTRRYDQWVRADEHAHAAAGAAEAHREAERWRALVEQLAHVTPRSGQWERSARAVQDRSRSLLATAVAPRAGRAAAGVGESTSDIAPTGSSRTP